MEVYKMLNVSKCVEVCVKKYGLDEKEALRIAKTDNILLSIEELRYKYDDMRIGTGYPDWITPEEHIKMCYATVWNKYYGSEKLSKNFYCCEDLVSDLYLYTLTRLHSYKGKLQLNGLLLCRLKNMVRDKTQEANCFCESYDWELDNVGFSHSGEKYNKYSKCLKYNYISTNTPDIVILLSTIASIKNDKVKGVLLLCGYFIANIYEFLNPLVDFYFSSSDNIKDKIYNLGKDDEKFCKLIDRTTDKSVEVSITVGKILKIFGKRSKSYLKTDLLPYLKNIGLVGGI